MDNKQIADAFDEMADLLELKQENPFRVRAYRTGARAIRGLAESVAEIVADSERQLADVPGIGKTLVEKTEVLLSTGTLPQLEKLREEIPRGVLAMVRIPGLGAKKAAALHKALGVESLEELKKACEAGKVAALKGFGQKTQQTILEGMELASAADERIYWCDADEIIHTLLTYMRSCDAIDRIEPAGSYRRGKETIGDLDLLVAASDAKRVMDHFEACPLVDTVILRGEAKKMSVRLNTGLQVDLRVVAADQFGAALQYFTGSQAHNVHLRQLAKKHGMRLNEYGLTRTEEEAQGGELVASETEESIYHALGLPWFDPAIREDRFEFEWAAEGQLPKLVELADMHGDLHMHTTATDGKNTLREMVQAACDRGRSYIAITDHSQRVAMAGGLDADRLRAQWDEIDRVREEFAGQITILKGIECDILESGPLDLPDDVLAEGDWIIASVHYGQRQSRTEITDRIVGAIANPHVNVIAHPTGRLINRRPPYEVDMDAVMQATAEHGKMLELNANPARLDLHEVHLTQAKRMGIPIVINTDAHSTSGLDVMRYGILQARRGGLTAEDVANASEVDAFLKAARIELS